MSEVLSQSQIDALINSMRSGDVTSEPEKKEKKYKKYDFYSPKKFTKDKLKLLSGIYENYARLCSSRINNLVRIASTYQRARCVNAASLYLHWWYISPSLMER